MSKLSSKVLVSWLNKLFTLNGLLGGKSQSDADHAKAADSSTDVSNSVEGERLRQNGLILTRHCRFPKLTKK
jgi:hypothetical protein